jgi:hypothetical protein
MNVEQGVRVLELVNDLPWADVDGAICDFELNLRLLVDATRDSLLLWEAEADKRGFHDEYLLGADDVRDLSEEWQLAYIARLVQNLALMYGSGDTSDAGEPARDTPAGLLRGLNDISWTPTTSERDTI